jgi:hypothetical protein
VISPTRAPSCCSRAFVAIVVPWSSVSMAVGSPSAALTPAIRPSEGSATVEGTLWIQTWAVSVSATMTSVNVPPTSTPASFIATPPSRSV